MRGIKASTFVPVTIYPECGRIILWNGEFDDDVQCMVKVGTEYGFVRRDRLAELLFPQETD